MRKITILLFAVLMFMFLFLGQMKAGDKKGTTTVNKTTTNDLTDYIAINQAYMLFANNGESAYNNITQTNGLLWPGGLNATVGPVFEDGLIWGGKVGTEIRVGGSTYRQGMQAGPILPNGSTDPQNPKYRIYKIRKGWELLPPGADRDRYESDYNNWPVEDGAPWVDIDGDKCIYQRRR